MPLFKEENIDQVLVYSNSKQSRSIQLAYSFIIKDLAVNNYKPFNILMAIYSFNQVFNIIKIDNQYFNI